MLRLKEIEAILSNKADVALKDAMVLWQGPKFGGSHDMIFIVPCGHEFMPDDWVGFDEALKVPMKTAGRCNEGYKEANKREQIAILERIFETAVSQGISRSAATRAFNAIPEWRKEKTYS